METIKLDDGYKEYAINGDENRILRINPTDITIIPKMEASLDKLRKELEGIEGIKISPTGNALEDGKNSAEVVRRVNKAMRDNFDEIFYPGAADIVFGAQSPLALSNGKTIYENFMESFIKTIKPVIESEAKKREKHISKYKVEYDRFTA